MVAKDAATARLLILQAWLLGSPHPGLNCTMMGLNLESHMKIIYKVSTKL